MKTPDSQNHMPIDKLKYFINAKILINYGLEKILVFVNPKKIDFNKIDELIFFQQERELVTLERIIDESKFNESKREAGFIDIEVLLKDIQTITKA